MPGGGRTRATPIFGHGSLPVEDVPARRDGSPEAWRPRPGPRRRAPRRRWLTATRRTIADSMKWLAPIATSWRVTVAQG